MPTKKAKKTAKNKASAAAKAPDLMPSVFEVLQRIQLSLERLAEAIREGNRLRARPPFSEKR